MVQIKMFDNYNHSYQMYAIRQNSIMLKLNNYSFKNSTTRTVISNTGYNDVKKPNEDDDWILCEPNNNVIHKNTLCKKINTNESIIKLNFTPPIIQNALYRNINTKETIIQHKYKPINDKTNGFTDQSKWTSPNKWFYNLFENCLNIIEELGLFELLYIFNKKRRPSICA